MKVAVAGLGLIGGSFYKASLKAGYETVGLHHGDATGCEDADLVVVAQPPEAIVPWIKAHAAQFKPGAIVLDICGVKEEICKEMAAVKGGFTFVGGHPMAGREVAGYENSLADLFVGASMIITPFDGTSDATLDILKDYFKSIGFAMTLVTTPRRHDEMIAFTSQLCHLISSAYVREPLSVSHAGYSAGSFRDMVRVGAPEPDTWTQLFFDNRDALLPVLDRYLARLRDFREALADDDRARLHRALETGVVAKAKIDEENITL